MNIPFFNCKSSSEKSFRCVICALALAVITLCLAYSLTQVLSNEAFQSFVMRTAFSSQSISELEAYYFRQTLICEELDSGENSK